MYKKYERLILTLLVCGTLIFLSRDQNHTESPPVNVSINIAVPETPTTDILEVDEVGTVSADTIVESPTKTSLTVEEARELTRIATAEAGNQSDYGIRLVIDTVLNRVEDPVWPDNVHDVIFQPNQYYTAGMNAVAFRHDILAMVYQEAEARTDTKVKFFARSWPRSGTRYLQEGDHYFNY